MKKFINKGNLKFIWKSAEFISGGIRSTNSFSYSTNFYSGGSI